jgi:hypothetical protein
MNRTPVVPGPFLIDTRQRSTQRFPATPPIFKAENPLPAAFPQVGPPLEYLSGMIHRVPAEGYGGK